MVHAVTLCLLCPPCCRIKGLMSAFRIEDLPIESQMLTDSLNEAQRKVGVQRMGGFAGSVSELGCMQAYQ